jgi:UDP-3-O-[3-hydroxymyristoyl] glucosamine N-acyltransferase
VIGDNVVIQAGTLIGTDAFYFKKEGGKYNPWHSCGRVVIGNDVSVGAGCTINRGVSGDTIIGEGSKLDCQVHLGHGVVLGKNCLLAAQVGIGGKTIIGDNVVIYGQVGIGQNIEIGDNAIILGQTGVTKNLEADKTYFGYPAQESRKYYKELATLRKLSNG